MLILLLTPSAIPKSWLYSGSTKIGIAPDTIKALIADLWTLRGKIIFSPLLTQPIIIIIIPEVVPLIKKIALSALKASAINDSASYITPVPL